MFCATKPCYLHMEKPIDFWLRKGKAVGETMPTERGANVISAGGASFRFRKERLPPRMVLNRACRSYYKNKKKSHLRL